MPTHLTVEQKRMAFRLQARGLSLRQIGREVGCTGMGVSVVLGAESSTGLSPGAENQQSAGTLESTPTRVVTHLAWIVRQGVEQASRGWFQPAEALSQLMDAPVASTG